MKKVLIAIGIILVAGGGILYFGGFFDKGAATQEDHEAADSVAEELLKENHNDQPEDVIPTEVDSSLIEVADSLFDDNYEEDFDPAAEL